MSEGAYTFSKFMHDLIDSEIWAKLSAAAKTLYPVLLRFSDETFKVVWPGTNRLLKLTGFKSKKSLQEARRELQKIGLIDYKPGSGRVNSRYYFRFEYENSNININTYIDTVLSRRGVSQSPPVEESSIPEREGAIPLYQDINININQNKKQEEFLFTLNKRLEKFLENLSGEKQNNQKNKITHILTKSYGSEEVEHALKIAIDRGKAGDIRYLEGILKNRFFDKEKSKKYTIGYQNHLPSFVNNLSVDSKEKLSRLHFRYCYGKTFFFETGEELSDFEGIKKCFKENGYEIKILNKLKKDSEFPNYTYSKNSMLA